MITALVPSVCPHLCTWLSLVDEDGRMGRQNFFMEPMAAGKAGAENSAATRFIRKIQDIISSSLLEREREREQSEWLVNGGTAGECTG